MKKILFYCQYLAGMGHLVRSTEIVRSLVKDFDVCLINGGQLIPGFEFPAEARVVHLPAVWEDGNKLKSVDSSLTIEEVKESRQHKILDVLDKFQPDCIITECFPFGKHKLMFELKPMLEQAKEINIPIICSLRDLIMTQPMSESARIRRQEKVCQLIDRFYDLVLFHGDVNLFRLEDSFPKVDKLSCDLFYTGYVVPAITENSPKNLEDIANLDRAEPTIFVSVGGGRHGYPLLAAMLFASPILKKSIPHKIYCFAGPFMSESEFQRLQTLSAEQERVVIRRYTPRLIQYMQQADLSISLGGYNTTMNILQTGVRALVLPSLNEHQADEQTIRARKLAQLDIVDLLQLQDLKPAILADKIVNSLNRPKPNSNFNLSGAATTASKLKELLCSNTIVAI
ncbi:MAG: glycosyltransferase [Cyanobacteria bacterium P01_A01_bin.83]